MSNIEFRGTYFSLCLDNYNNEFVAADNEVLIVPVTTTNHVLLIKEPSPAFNTSTLVLPGGIINLGEQPQDAASRELREETGYAPGKNDFLGEIRPFSKYLQVRSFVYLARNLYLDPLTGDEPYTITHHETSWDEIEQLVAKGMLLDGRVLAALYLARSYMQKEISIS